MFVGQSGLMLREKAAGFEPVVELTGKSVQKWADSLPIANLAESAHHCYRLLVDMNKSLLSGDKRLRLLQIVETVADNLRELLEKQFLINRIELSDKQRKIAAIVQAIDTELALGFHAAIDELCAKDPGWLGKKTLAKAIASAIRYHSWVIMRCYQLYTPVPGRLWHEIYTLYKLATRFELSEIKLEQKDSVENEVTISGLTVKILLVSTTNPYQLRQNVTRLLWDELDRFCSQCELKSHAFNNQHFVVDLDSSSPPTPKSLSSRTRGDNLLKLSTQNIVESVKLALAQLNQKGATGNTYRLLYRHLILCWSQPAQRAFARTPSNELLEVCIGLGATHYLLSQTSIIPEDESEPDQLSAMEGSLRNATIAEVARAERNQAKHSFDYLSSSGSPGSDVWAKLYRPDQAVNEEQPLTQHRSKESIVKESYRLQESSLVNMSPGGYCLQFQAKELPRHAQTGEIIGILEHLQGASSPWTLGVIRWVKRVSKTDTVQMGVQLLAPAVLPVSIKSRSSRDDHQEYQRALLLPEMPGLEQPATIITNPLSFSTNSKVRILDHGREYDARLYKEVAASSSFRQFCFEKLSSGEKKNSPFDTQTSSKPGEEPDNIWDLI